MNKVVHVKFQDRTQEFVAKTAVFSDSLVALMAAGIENKIKTGREVPYLPHDKARGAKNQKNPPVAGALRASIKHQKLAVGHYEVTVGQDSPAAAYAAAQEAGVTRGHPITHYSTEGTGPHFFQHAIDNVKGRTRSYISQAKRAARLEEII